MLLRTPWIPLTIGASIAGTFYSFSRGRVLNDTGAIVTQPAAVVPIKPVELNSRRIYTEHGITRFDGKLDYYQLTWGSIAGVVSGYIFGKMSKLLATIVLGGLFTTEYLQYTGHINVNPWARRIYDWGAENLNQEILVKDPSFKISFAAAFLVAAFNA